MNYLFPEIATDNGIAKQIDKIQDEIHEAIADICFDRRERALEECIDILQATETMLRIMVKRLGEDKVLELIRCCIKKNMSRGYYTELKDAK